MEVVAAWDKALEEGEEGGEGSPKVLSWVVW